MAAVLRNIESQGWIVEESDSTSGTVVAVTPFEADSNLITRERWIFSIGDQDVAVQLFLEAADATDPADVVSWRSYDVVCAGYSYSRERTQLASIAAHPEASLALNP